MLTHQHDFQNHSEGYWRSIFIWELPSSFLNKINFTNKIIIELDKIRVKEYFFHYYDERIGDAAPHITFRINFPTLKELKQFEKYLNKKKIPFTSKNYDENSRLKEAYQVGFNIYQAFLNSNLFNRRYTNKHKLDLLIAFHGLFNNLNYSRGEELEYYLYALKNLIEGREEQYLNIT